MSSDDICTICTTPRSEHGDRKHQFRGAEDRDTSLIPKKSGGDASLSDTSVPQGSLGIASKGDPVLRLALIRAGVLTAQDLDVVEAELKASGLGSFAPSTLA